MQTILGSGGAIGTPLAKELLAYTDKIRLVSRNPKRINPGDELFPADLTLAGEVDKAIEGSEVVYLTVGFEYNIRVWKKQWPSLMRNVIESCKKHGAKLVFFDNIYMYDRDHLGHLTEDTPVRPTSRKGKIRAEIAGMILREIEKESLIALIARSADFYGAKNSILVEMVYKNLIKGKKAMWFADANRIHTFTSAWDAAKATAVLGNTPDAYNQVWHLPTDNTPLTGRQWIEMIAGMVQQKPSFTVLPVWLVALLGVFVPIMREFSEMAYQYDRDYVFNSSKFEKRFGFSASNPKEGIKRLVDELRK
jgi:nucleoside-diphosphate-sugar epimerase